MNYLDTFENALQEWASTNGASPSIGAAIRYMLFPGGKRIRARLLLSIASDLGLEVSRVVPVAMAVELLHTSSLIHDDLPCLDNDDLRRGRPSCHKKFDEATALLAGDFLIAAAFSLLGSMQSITPYVAELTRCIGVVFCDLCAGQDLDRYPPGDEETLIRIHELKTGKLFQFCCESPSILAGEKGALRTLWGRLGVVAGVCFQLLDDLEDLYQDSVAPLASTEGFRLSRSRLLELIDQYQRETCDILMSIHEGCGCSLRESRSVIEQISGRGLSDLGQSAS